MEKRMILRTPFQFTALVLSVSLSISPLRFEQPAVTCFSCPHPQRMLPAAADDLNHMRIWNLTHCVCFTTHTGKSSNRQINPIS